MSNRKLAFSSIFDELQNTRFHLSAEQKLSARPRIDIMLSDDQKSRTLLRASVMVPSIRRKIRMTSAQLTYVALCVDRYIHFALRICMIDNLDLTIKYIATQNQQSRILQSSRTISQDSEGSGRTSYHHRGWIR